MEEVRFFFVKTLGKRSYVCSGSAPELGSKAELIAVPTTSGTGSEASPPHSLRTYNN